MGRSKKRNAEEAFADYDSTAHKSKNRRRPTENSKLASENEEKVKADAVGPAEKFTATYKSRKRQRRKDNDKLPMEVEKAIESSAAAMLTEPTDHGQSFEKGDSNRSSTFQAENRNSKPASIKAEPIVEDTTISIHKRKRMSKKENKKKHQQVQDEVKPHAGHIGRHAVTKAGVKKLPEKPNVSKPKVPHWNLSDSVGGIFIDQDPVLVDRDQYLILPTAHTLQVYSTSTSLLLRIIHVSDNDSITSCVVDPSNMSHIILSCLSGTVQSWDWTTGHKKEQWACQPDLLEIVAVVAEDQTEALARYKLVTVHDTSGVKNHEEVRLIQSHVSSRKIPPDEEVLLLTKQSHLSGSKSIAGADLLLLSFGEQLLIGQLLSVSGNTNEQAYTWREVFVPQPVESIDVKIRDRPKTPGSSPVKMIDVVIGCVDGVIIVYEDLLYRLICKEEGVRDVELLSRRLHWHRQAVKTVKWSRDGNYLVSGGTETVLVIWQLDTNQQQFLPHLSTAILNLTISDAGSSYVLRLADNSVMVLSTADLLPSANISGLALKDDVNQYRLAALSPRDPNQLLIAIHTESLTEEPSSVTMLQAFDTRTARQTSRQALARNMTTALRIGPNGVKVHEPNVSHMKTSHDGNWLVTVDEWRPDPHDLDALHSAGFDQKERSQSAELCLRFWKWQEEGSEWGLVTRVDEPHSLGKKSVLDLAMHPTKLEASTVGSDGMLRKWSPMARYRDGMAVKDKTGQVLYTWMCSKTVKLEPDPAITNDYAKTSAAMAYSEDGSVIAASWSWSAQENRVVHIINARSTEVSVTQANILSPGPAQLAFSSRYLLALSHNFCVWDTVALQRTYSIFLRHTSRDGKFLAVNTNDGTFALAFDSRQPTRPSDIAVFDVRNPEMGPVLQRKIHGHVRILLPQLGSSGYLIIDSEARIRHLTPPGAVRSTATIAKATAKDSTRGLKDIFGARSTVLPKTGDETNRVGQLTLPSTSTEGDSEQKSLDQVLSSITSAKLPSVRQMFEQVTSLFARKPAAAA